MNKIKSKSGMCRVKKNLSNERCFSLAIICHKSSEGLSFVRVVFSDSCNSMVFSLAASWMREDIVYSF